MTYAVQSKSLETIEWSDIEALVTEGAEESATLEFKSAGIWGDEVFGKDDEKPLLTAHDMAKNDVVEAICGFANAYGGVLVVGVLTSGAPDRATKIDPVADVEKKAQKLREIGATSFDPPLYGLQMRVVADVSDQSQGAIIFRTPASLAAPHAAKYAVIAGKRSAQKPLTTDVAMWRPFVRRNADTKEMSMRDLHNVFWENRVKQERIIGIRREGNERLKELREERDTGNLCEREGGKPVPPVQRGVFVRCTSVYQDPLNMNITRLRQLQIPPSENVCFRGFGIACDLDPRKRPIPRGFLILGTFGTQLKVETQGAIQLHGFHPHEIRHDKKYTYVPEFVSLFARIALISNYMARESDKFGSPFEIDMHLKPEMPYTPIFDGNDTRFPMSNYIDEFSVGPFLISSKDDFIAALKYTQVEIYRGFGSEREKSSLDTEKIEKFSSLYIK